MICSAAFARLMIVVHRQATLSICRIRLRLASAARRPQCDCYALCRSWIDLCTRLQDVMATLVHWTSFVQVALVSCREPGRN